MMNSTTLTAEPFVILSRPEPLFAFERILQLARAIARLPLADQGTVLSIFLEALSDEGVDVQELVPCVLDGMTE